MKFTICVVEVFKNMKKIPMKLAISIQDRRNFFLSMSNLLKERGNYFLIGYHCIKLCFLCTYHISFIVPVINFSTSSIKKFMSTKDLFVFLSKYLDTFSYKKMTWKLFLKLFNFQTRYIICIEACYVICKNYYQINFVMFSSFLID